MPDTPTYEMIDGALVDLSPERKVEIEAAWAAEAASTPVPPSVTRAQGRIWLHRNGHLSNVTAAVNASDDEELKIWWADAQEWRRTNANIVALGTAFGIDLDTAFREASLIN